MWHKCRIHPRTTLAIQVHTCATRRDIQFVSRTGLDHVAMMYQQRQVKGSVSRKPQQLMELKMEWNGCARPGAKYNCECIQVIISCVTSKCQRACHQFLVQCLGLLRVLEPPDVCLWSCPHKQTRLGGTIKVLSELGKALFVTLDSIFFCWTLPLGYVTLT